MSTDLKRVGDDHEEMLAWAEIHRTSVRREFIRWLLSSRLRVACDADPPETTVGRHTPMKLYIKYLAQAGINTTSDPEDVLARRFTKRVLCHLLKGVRFARKPV